MCCKECELEDHFLDNYNIGCCRDCYKHFCVLCSENIIDLDLDENGLKNDITIKLNELICGYHVNSCKKDKPLLIKKDTDLICNLYCDECYIKLV